MEVKEMILLHEDFLQDFGFELDRNTFHYSKPIPEGKQVVFFHHTQHTDVSYVEYHLGIRLEPVEVIVNKFLPSLGDYKDRSITIIETLDQINKSLPKRFLVENEMEINSVVQTAEEFLVKEGFSWLDEYSDPIKLERLFNSQIFDNEIITQNFTYRSARGATLCKLYNPSEYEDVKNFYLEKLEEMQVTPFTLACFLNLLDHIENF